MRQYLGYIWDDPATGVFQTELPPNEFWLRKFQFEGATEGAVYALKARIPAEPGAAPADGPAGKLVYDGLLDWSP